MPSLSGSVEYIFEPNQLLITVADRNLDGVDFIGLVPPEGPGAADVELYLPLLSR